MVGRYDNRNPNKELCSVPGCTREWFVRRLCPMHYNRWRKTGGTDLGSSGPTRIADHAPWLIGNKDRTDTECFTWPYGNRGRADGRAMITFRGVCMSASKAMCILAHGEPPTRHHVAAHSCGNGHQACLNPSHLRWATRKENQADMLIHGTAQIGEKSNKAILTEPVVRSIYADYKAGETPNSLARKHQVSVGCIAGIVYGSNWKHLNLLS